MHIISGLDDFKKVFLADNSSDKWQNWYSNYYCKYNHVLDLIFAVLHNAQVKEMKERVRNLTYGSFINTAEKFINDGGIKCVKNSLKEAEDYFDFTYDYKVYLLIGLGFVDATSLPADPPFIYFGLEHYRSIEQLKYVLPHEFNHLVRFCSIGRDEFMNFSKITVKQFIILEGLATIFPLVLKDQKIHPLSIVDVKMIPEDAGEYCLKNEEQIFENLMQVWDNPITPDIMQKYFVSSAGWRGEKPEKMGYYVGSRIIGQLINNGWDIRELTTMKTEKIIDLWNDTQ